MKTKTIKQFFEFGALPKEVFDALMDSKKHSKFTGARAVISNRVGGKFSAYDGYIDGTNLELVEGKKIVQNWHCADWPKDHFSKATFLLSRTKNGAKLSFTQTNVPAETFEQISEGWFEHYWEKMREMFAKAKK